MALAPATIFDSFSRSLQNSWGTTDSGHTWLGETSDYDSYLSQGYGRIYVPANRGTSVAYIDANQTSQEVLIKVKWNVDTLTDHGPVIRRQNASNYYYVRIQDYFHEISINAVVGGTVYELNRVGGVTLNKDTYYWVRFRSDSNLKFKIWADGTAEPGTWTLQSNFFDGSNPPGAGGFGYYSRGTTSTYSVYLDSLYWYSLEDDERGLPVTDTFSRNVDKGWGWSDSGHLWEGHFADDPTYYAFTGQGNVTTSGYARLTATNEGTSRLGFIGPVVANSEVLAQVYVDNATGGPFFEIGLRGETQPSAAGMMSWRGIYARLTYGSTTLAIRRVTTLGGASSQAGTGTLSSAPAAGELWWVRVQAQGTTVRARAWKDGTTEPGTWTVSVTESTLTSGRSFVRITPINTGTYNFRVYDFSHTVITSGNQLNVGSLTTNNVTDTSFGVTASYTNDNDADSSCTIQYKAQGSDTWSSATVTTDRANKRFTASVTGLTQGTRYEVKATYTDPDGVSGTNPLTTTVDTALNGLDTGSLTLTADASTIDVVASYTNDDDNDSSATARYRVSPAGAWSTAIPMTANRSLKQFTTQLAGLDNDTTYDVEVTFTDSDAVRGTNPLNAVATTIGKGVRFASPIAITVTPSDVAAIVNVYYDLDTNDDSSVAVQYKSIRDALWTTVTSSAISVDRSAKQFRVILSGLIPNLSYQVKTTLSDPDGVVAGTDVEKTAVFTTTGFVSDPDKRGKHYVYKVYDEDGNYLGTWRDAPEPTFGWHENGGISDLSVTLPRKLADLNADPTLDFGHRVDVWAIDGTSDGMGVNLLHDSDMDLGSWTLTTSWSVDPTGGPDGGAALKFSSNSTTQRTVQSETIDLAFVVPLVVKMVARARGGKLRMDIAAFDASDNLLDVADDNAETVGNGWQSLKLEWTPPAGTAYVRVRVSNVGKGTMWFDKVEVLQKECLVYRGRIESYTPKVKQEGEEVEVEILGLVSQLTDLYVRFLQYARIQPTRDSHDHPNQNQEPTDPANMMKALIDLARQENPRCDLYYTTDSIKLTGTTVEYTFRDQQLVTAFDKIRMLCPPGWHWYVEPDGLVNLRGPEHVRTHKLRLAVEVMEFENERTIRDLKNYIIVKGRQDADESEPDGFGSIEYHAFDQASIDRYGKRVLLVRDANIKDPDTAELVGDGRLDEYNRVQEAGSAYVPDEKDVRFAGGALRGYNIEAFRPGDFVQVKDPVSGSQRTYWDQFLWDVGAWDDHGNRVLPTSVPIKTIQYRGDHVILELSERQPSASGDFAKLARWLQLQEADTAD